MDKREGKEERIESENSFNRFMANLDILIPNDARMVIEE